ncbi:MAG: hypothetical protein A2Y91_06775 [Chloroflexi bacterium RBG_13_54_8]|nr:MAG: hypothetical protein A2Y91_06775 [Chloroflexi bacterium RBG_13_54_8]
MMALGFCGPFHGHNEVWQKSRYQGGQTGGENEANLDNDRADVAFGAGGGITTVVVLLRGAIS